MNIPGEVIAVIAVLTIFLTFITALKYAVRDTFVRTRLIMTSFFFFIVATLTIAFWKFTFITLPFTTPAFIVGILVGYVVGVKEAERRVMVHGVNHYLEHFAHIHISDLKNLHWWSIVNFYTVMAALLLINLVGFSTVILHGAQSWIIATCAVGAFLQGTIVPYLLHLWSLTAGEAKARV